MDFSAVWATILFAGALVLLAKHYSILKSLNVVAARQLIWGVGLLGIATLLLLTPSVGLIARAQAWILLDLIAWICIIAGIAFNASGVSVLTPLTRALRHDVGRTKLRTDMIIDIERLFSIEHRFIAIAEAAFNHLCAVMSPRWGMVIEHHNLDNSNSILELFQVEVDQDALVSRVNEFRWRELTTGIVTSDELGIVDLSEEFLAKNHLFVLRISVGPESELVMLFSGEKADWLSEEDRLFCELAGDMLNRTARQLSDDSTGRDWTSIINHFSAMSEIGTGRLAQQLPRWLKSAQEVLPLKRIALAVCEFDTATSTRYLVQEGGGTLVDKRLDPVLLHRCREIRNETAASMFPIPMPEIDLGWAASVDQAGEENYLACLNITPGTEVLAAFTLKAETELDRTSLRKLHILSLSLQPLLAHELTLSITERLRRHSTHIAEMTSLAEGATASSDMLARLADLLREELDADAVRISFSTNGDFLHSRALSLREGIDAVVPPEGIQILRLMANHRQVLLTGKMLVVSNGEDDTFCLKEERHQMLSDEMTSMLLAPVITDGQTHGIISVMTTGKNRLQSNMSDNWHHSITTATGVCATILAAEQSGSSDSSGRTVYKPVMLRQQDVDPTVRTGMRSSLSGILGSVEAIKHNENISDEELNKYISIIDRSAGKLQQFLQEEISAE